MVLTQCCSWALVNVAGMHTTTFPASRNAVTVRFRRRDRRISTVVSGMKAPYPEAGSPGSVSRIGRVFFIHTRWMQSQQVRTAVRHEQWVCQQEYPLLIHRHIGQPAQPFHKVFHKPSQLIRHLR
jgi:hypothetical protein